MSPPFRKHVFVCLNSREPGNPRGSCAQKGSEELHAAFKSALKKRGLAGDIRANKAGCLDRCAGGPVAVVYPDAVWYTFVDDEDIDEIVESHLKNGEVVERLLLSPDVGR